MITRTLVVVLPMLLLARLAAAQPAGTVQLDEFRPAMDAHGYLSLNGSETLGGGELSFGLGSLDWGRHMLALGNGTSSYSVDDMVSATLVGALGVPLGELGVSLPVSIVDGTGQRIDGQGVGDLGVHFKARLLHAGPLGLGVLASVYLPTANEQLAGNPGVTPQLVGLADLSLGRVRVALNGGIRLSQTQTFTEMSPSGPMGTVAYGNTLPYGAALAYALVPEKVELLGEVFGAMPLGQHENYDPLEAMGGVKVYLAKNSYMTLGVGRGLVSEGGNPDARAFIGIVFEPKPAAMRHAALDDDDVVAVAPPPPPPPADEPDRDGDGVADKDDKCPDEPGTAYNQGCPDRDLVAVTDSAIVPLRSIEFEFDSATLKTSAFPVLDSVVQALVDNPGIARVEVQGHTDERGDDAYNLDLSNRRAASVMAYLVAHGIAAARLESHGYGETRPIDPAHNEAAWTKNRRVEFVIEDHSR
ncbi:MAG TPA: OmpA family protein [Kofleriaceae bacterium]|jgi:outer membrane protein OmpA-like peptidoglycan-associated protein